MDIRERQSMLLCLDTKFHFSSLAVGHFLRLKPLQNGSKRDMGKQNLSGSGYGPVAGACEHSDESLRFHRKQEISCVAYGLILKASDDGVGWLVGILGYCFIALNCANATPTSKIVYSRDTNTVCISIYSRISLIIYKLLLIINLH